MATAFGGGIATVRNPGILHSMRGVQRSYPVQSRLDYLKRICKYSAVALPLNLPLVNGIGRKPETEPELDTLTLMHMGGSSSGHSR